MLWTSEGFVLDDAGTMLTTSYIDLRDKDERTVIRSLVKHIMITATDEDRETIRSHATRRRQSFARYLVGLATKDTFEGNEGPPLALETGDQRERFDTLRRTCLLLERDDNANSMIADIQVRVAVMFDLLAQEFTAKGKAHDFHAALVRIVGEDRATTFMASVTSTTPKRPRKRIEHEPEPDLFS